MTSRTANGFTHGLLSGGHPAHLAPTPTSSRLAIVPLARPSAAASTTLARSTARTSDFAGATVRASRSRTRESITIATAVSARRPLSTANDHGGLPPHPAGRARATERDRTDLTAADVRSCADTMARDASAYQLRSEGATIHDVPGRRQATTAAEAAAHFSFA